MRTDVINKISEKKLIAIVRGVPSEKLIPMTKALYNGGIRLLEVTYSADGSTPDEITAENIKKLSTEFDGKMYIGAGTVIKKSQVELTYNAGGKFIISPDTFEDVIKATRELNMVSIPGAFTPTEIQAAHRYGADFVKLFPAVQFDREYIKAVKAPLSHIKLLMVGGVNLNNIKDFLDIGINGFGIGSAITNKKMIEENDFDGLTKLARSYVDAING